MTLDTTSAAANWHSLLVISDVVVDGTPSQTVRWSDIDLTMSDGTFYEGRIRSTGALLSDLGRLLETQFVFPGLEIELYNGDDAIRVILDANANLAGKAAVLSIGQGTTGTDYEVRFTGEARHPDGIQWDEDVVFITFTDSAERGDTVLPANSVWPTTYANAEAKSKYHAIPEVLGDFRTTAGGGEKVPGFCVDTTAGQFTFGEYLQEVEDVYLNGVSASYTVDQLTGPSLVTLADTYDPLVDSVSASVNGRVTTNAGAYPAAENAPTAWAYDILTESWGMNLSSSTQVDTAVFNATYAASYYGAGDKCRRWVGSEVQAATLLAEIGIDGFFELFINAAGKWTAVFRLAAAPASTTVVHAADLMPAPNGGRVFSVQSDPERTYANQIVYDYRLKPPLWVAAAIADEGGYAASGVVNNTGEQTTVGGITRRRLSLRWLYVDGADRGNRDLYTFSGRLEMANVGIGTVGLKLGLADTFELVYSKYELSTAVGTPFMIRSTAPDFTRGTAQVTAWNIDRLSPRRYQADGSAAWAAATTYDKSVMGYHGAFSGDDEQLYM